MRIKITEGGPYIVTGSVPLRELIITQEGHHNVMEQGREFPLQESYALCRCGHSKDAPYCDGSHEHAKFVGKEVADRRPYEKRLTDVVEGSTMTLLDDGRCAYARFCHRERGDVWTLTENDGNSKNRGEAIIAARECPSGRLVMIDEEGNPLEDENQPEIIILQDPQQGVSAGIFVKGGIIIEAADGTEYEARNRVALCRCGHSKNLPFCDASHVPARYRDAKK